MALAHTLSALRTLMLDQHSLPPSLSEREALYSSLFPNLTKDERSDLVKILPEKLSIYTNCIFNGEGSTLAAHFELSLWLLSTRWESVFKQKFVLLNFIKALHRFSPWKGNTTALLAQSYIAYLESEALSSIRQLAPQVVALAKFENDTMLLKRAPIAAQSSAIDTKDLLALSLAELLQIKVALSPLARLASYPYEVKSIAKACSQKAAHAPELDSYYYIYVRTPKFTVHWHQVPEALFNTVSSEPDLIITLQDVAQWFVQTLPAMSEEQQCSQFLAFLMPTIADGCWITSRN